MSQSPCGWPSSQTSYGSPPWWAVTPPTSIIRRRPLPGWLTPFLTGPTGRRAYAELPLVSEGYPPPRGRLPTCSSPVRHVSRPKPTPSDLHALGAPPALILSQDQTLHQDPPKGTVCCVFASRSQPDGPLMDPPAPSSARPHPLRPLSGPPRAAAPASLRCLHRPTDVGHENAPSKGGGNQLDPESSGSGEGRLCKTTYATLASSSVLASHFDRLAAGLSLTAREYYRTVQGMSRHFARQFFGRTCDAYSWPTPRRMVLRDGANELVIT